MNTYMFVYSHSNIFIPKLERFESHLEDTRSFQTLLLWEKTPTFGRNDDISQHWGATASGVQGGTNLVLPIPHA